jgi:hypothetical protein
MSNPSSLPGVAFFHRRWRHHLFSLSFAVTGRVLIRIFFFYDLSSSGGGGSACPASYFRGMFLSNVKTFSQVERFDGK